MTDMIKGSIWPWEKADLIARLLAEETDLTDCAADCIEELEKQCSVYARSDRIFVEEINELEAKLTKAVEFLKTMADYNKYVIAPFLAKLGEKE
jgi:Zn-dependent M32 family carboxypeptidase